MACRQRLLRQLAGVLVSSLAIGFLTFGCTAPAPVDGTAAGPRSPAPATPAATHAVTADFATMQRQLMLQLSTGAPELKAVRTVLVSVDGRQVVSYFHGRTPTESAHVWSVTKSVVSILVGIAVDEGRLRLDQTLRELLPGETSSMTPQVEAVTLRQLLTMTAGVQKEGGRFLRISGKAGEFSVEAVDAVSQILTFGFTNDPGAIFEYSNGSAHLVSAVLREAIDEPILEYARERLFDPLGIKTRPAWQGSDTGPKGGFDQAGFAWATDRSGINLGALGLKLTASDLLKLGDLYINGGRWHGQQIVSAQWVQESTSPQLLEQQQLAGDPQYGYLWLPFEINGHRGFEASGSYTQKIVGFPDLHAVVVVTAADDTLGEEDLNPVLGAVMDDVVFTPLTS